MQGYAILKRVIYMLISIEELKTKQFVLSDITVFSRRPSCRVFEIEKRETNGFMYMREGRCEYEFSHGSFEATPGALVYLPAGSSYKRMDREERTAFHVIHFRLTVSNEIAQFSDFPTIITHQLMPEAADAIMAMEAESSTILQTEKLCFLLSSLEKSTVSPQAKKLYPAVSYIREHLTEPFSAEKLSNLCFLSTAQFYHLFVSEYKMTPLAYRNRLILNRAETLLRQEEVTVGEVSDSLGFESNAYFSRFFKKHKGISPSEYIKHQ